MSQQTDYKQGYIDARNELIETKAKLVTIESMYWKQQKLLNDDQAETENYKELYLAAKQENEALRRKIAQFDDPTDYKQLYQSTLREKREMLRKLSLEVETYKTKYEQAKETFDAQKKELIKKSRTLQSEREKRLRARIDSLENLLKRYKSEGAKALRDFGGINTEKDYGG